MNQLKMLLAILLIFLLIITIVSRFVIADPVDGEVPTFPLTDVKIYFPADALSTQDHVKLF